MAVNYAITLVTDHGSEFYATACKQHGKQPWFSDCPVSSFDCPIHFQLYKMKDCQKVTTKDWDALFKVSVKDLLRKAFLRDDRELANMCLSGDCPVVSKEYCPFPGSACSCIDSNFWLNLRKTR